VVIPAFNRVEPLKYTLRSAARAAAILEGPVEVLLVDDGSNPSIETQMDGFDAGIGLTHLRQTNKGSIEGRLAGLRAATGDCILFLDSDDLVHPDKFRMQLSAMDQAKADISYADMAVATLGANYEVATFNAADLMADVNDPAGFFIGVQPAPHNPIYSRPYLIGALENPIVPATRQMDPSGDVWLFYNLAIQPAKIVKVRAPLSAPGPHQEDRFSRHWERLGVAALLVMERFMAECPKTDATLAARKQVGAAAFRTWRGLPRDFNDQFERRMLAIFQQAPRVPAIEFGTPKLARLARLLGPLNAGRLMRLLRSRPYSETRTLSDDEYGQLFSDFKGS
jgi:glycosyltransferase involved in cell wall biosynthesis